VKCAVRETMGELKRRKCPPRLVISGVDQRIVVLQTESSARKTVNAALKTGRGPWKGGMGP